MRHSLQSMWLVKSTSISNKNLNPKIHQYYTLVKLTYPGFNHCEVMQLSRYTSVTNSAMFSWLSHYCKEHGYRQNECPPLRTYIGSRGCRGAMHCTGGKKNRTTKCRPSKGGNVKEGSLMNHRGNYYFRS